MKTLLLLICFVSIVSARSYGQIKFHVMTEKERMDRKGLYIDGSKKIHYEFNGKDSIISKSFASKLLKQWRYKAVPKRTT